MRTTADGIVRKRKFWKRLVHCFQKSSSTQEVELDSIKAPNNSTNLEEDMTSVVSQQSSEDGDPWRFHQRGGSAEDMDCSDRSGSTTMMLFHNDDDDDDDEANSSIIIGHRGDDAVDCSANGQDDASMSFLTDRGATQPHVAPRIVNSLVGKHGTKRKSVLLDETPERRRIHHSHNGIKCKRNLIDATGHPDMLSSSTSSTTSTTATVPMLPLDVWREICLYVNDPITLCRVSCVSKDLHQRVQEASPIVWKRLYEHRWIRSSTLLSSSSSSSSSSLLPSPASFSFEDDEDDNNNNNNKELTKQQRPTVGDDGSDEDDNNNKDDWKKQFQRRFLQEGKVIRTMQQVVLTELEPDICDFDVLLQQQRAHGRIASICIEHAGWRHLLQQQSQQDSAPACGLPLDVLCAMANGETSYHPALARLATASCSPSCVGPSSSPFRDYSSTTMSWFPLHPRALARRRALLRFAAASTTFTFHCQEVITEMANVWERSLYQQIMNPTFTTTPTTQRAYEETAVLLSHALRSVPSLLQRTSSLAQLQTSMSQQLDQMAQVVQRHVEYYMDKRQDRSLRMCETREFLFTVHYVLSKHYGIRTRLPLRFRGGGDEQVLHACSIAHVLLEYPQQQQQQQQQSNSPMEPNWCHPILVAIIYQAVARRLGWMGDILFCPENCHTLLRFSSSSTTAGESSSSSSSSLLFLDLVQDPGRIMTLAQCQELIRKCQLLTEQDYSERSRRQLFLDHHHDDDMDDMDEDLRTAFWSQPPMSIPSVVYWLAAPFFSKHDPESDGMDQTTTKNSTTNDDDEAATAAAEEEDQPFDFLLGQLVESSGGGGGRLISFLQDRMVFFSSMMRHCKLIS